MLGTRLDVWELVALRRDFESEHEFAAEYGLSADQIGTALGYYQAFPVEVECEIACGRRSERDLAEDYPFIREFAVTREDG